MKLLALSVLHKEDDTKVKILQDEFNLNSFGWYERRGYVRYHHMSHLRTISLLLEFNNFWFSQLEPSLNIQR
jgi:hypothetical protein